MNRSTNWSYQSVFYLAGSLFFGAVFLRSILIYQGRQELIPVLGILLFWLALAASEPAFSHRWPGYFLLYLVVQTVLVFILLTMPGFPDFFAVLLMILSMQLMLRLEPKVVAVWIGSCALIMALLFTKTYRSQAVALTLIYSAGSVFVGSFALATRRANEARIQNQALAQQLQEANRQLQAYSEQLEHLAVARERNRLARDLHDSVTQTVFSMNLTAQSAALLLARDRDRVGEQLERMGQLAQSALSEMQMLISELQPMKALEGGFVSSLRQHLASRRLAERLAVTLEIEGDQRLGPDEEQGLFRIFQEALNNILKHTQAGEARISLHLGEPFWLEIEDQGQGFDLQQGLASGGVGLASMCERAVEIGWDLKVVTSPGAGTRVRVDKIPSRGR